jgi:adenylate cyclase
MAWELGQRLLSLAQRLEERAYLLEAHRALGTTQFFRGEFSAALTHLHQAMLLYEPPQSAVAHVLGDPQVSCLIYAARALWCLGYPDQALAKSQESLRLGQQLAHPYSMAWSHSFVADLYVLCGKDDVALPLIEASLAIATEQGLPFWIARGIFIRGLLLSRQGHCEDGLAQMRQGLEAMGTTGAELNRASFLARLAEASSAVGQPEAAHALLDEAMLLMDKNAERWWEAELYRVRGEVLRQQIVGAPVMCGRAASSGWQPKQRLARGRSSLLIEAEGYFQRALDISRRQQARMLELRAASGLSRLWQQQGNSAAAERLLSEIYAWFTEGFGTPDLRFAGALLRGAAPP